MKQTKCPYCNTWNEGDRDICDSCKKDMFLKEKEDLAKRHAADTNYMRMVPINENDGLLQKLWKHPVRIAQLIFMGIISIIAAIASSTVH